MSLLLQITIFLGVALIIVPLGKRFGLATVLGYIFTGIVLGPSVFNLADAALVQQLNHIGIIGLMFLIGLELRPQRLWHLRHSIFVLGGMQVLITGLVLMTTLWLLFQQNLSNSFVVGFALALSSTAMVLQLLTEKQQLNSPHGQKSFSILLFQDIAVIPFIAIIPLLAGSSSSHHGIAYFAAIIAMFSGLFLLNRYVLRPFFRFLIKSGAKELLSAVGLFMVLGVLIIIDVLNISLTLGAFLTGILLADSEFRHEFEASLAPFKAILLGVFFMSVGMTIQVSVLIDTPIFILAAVLLLMMIKFIVMIGVARYDHQTWGQSTLLAAGLAQGGEFAYIIFAVAQSEHVLSQTILEPAILIVTLSLLFTPIVYSTMQRWVVPRLNQIGKSKKQDSEMLSDLEQDARSSQTVQTSHHPAIIIAGFGRFGQIVARLAHLHRFQFTAIDNNVQHLDFIQQYGGKLCEGDASVPELLQIAGIQHAKVFVLAIDDVEASMNIARHIRLNYPHLSLLVRARDRYHMHALKDLGIAHIWRENYLSSLGLSYQALCDLGISPIQAHNSIDAFRDYDQQLLAEQQRIYSDEHKVYESYDNVVAELEYIFNSDAQYTALTHLQQQSHQSVQYTDQGEDSLQTPSKTTSEQPDHVALSTTENKTNRMNVCRDEEI